MCPVFNIDQTFKEGRIEGRKTFFLQNCQDFSPSFSRQKWQWYNWNCFYPEMWSSILALQKGGHPRELHQKRPKMHHLHKTTMLELWKPRYFCFLQIFWQKFKKSTSIANAGMYKALSSALLIEWTLPNLLLFQFKNPNLILGKRWCIGKKLRVVKSFFLSWNRVEDSAYDYLENTSF